MHPESYHDSVTLMLASRDAELVAGVTFAAAVMGTPVNLDLLRDQGVAPEQGVGPNDLIVAIAAEDDAAADTAMEAVRKRLSGGGEDGPPEEAAPKTIRSAARRAPGVNVAVISVPGRFSAYESAAALDAGLNVFCFSDGMSTADEAVLKRRAVERNLLMMGADCGTAIIDGVGFGFANAVDRGPVGIVAASGTGLQLITCLLDSVNVGISHAIGVGGRDLSADVGGTMSLHALELLAHDDTTEVIALISKPPDPAVARRVSAAARRIVKPVVLGFLGETGSLEGTAAKCAELCGARIELEDALPPATVTPGTIKGFFCGGTLCEEVASVVRDRQPAATFVDYGDDKYTEGRAHPMIDPTLRNRAVAGAVADPNVGAVVVDVVLGFGAHDNPAAELAPTIQGDRGATVIAVLCGSSRDPQDFDAQAKSLGDAGAIVTRNAAHAGRLALAATGILS